MLQRTERPMRQNELNSRKTPRKRLETRQWTHRLRSRDDARGRFLENAMSDAPIDPKAFRDFERAAHDQNAGSYHEFFSAVTDRAVAPLLDAAGVRAGTRLIEVAAGPGRLAGAAAQRGARVTGVDLAPAMVALARSLHPGIEFREGSADALPFADAVFDAVICGFGLGHFAEPERAAGELVRVLAPGGRAAVTWWEGFAQNRINGIFYEALGRFAVSTSASPPAGPPIDRFSDRGRLAEFLRAAGLTDIRVGSVSFVHRLRDADELWALAMGSFARASATIRAQTEDVQRQIRKAVTEAARAHASPAGLDMPVAFLVGSGARS
jgi:SAM-dependent methyltransferase